MTGRSGTTARFCGEERKDRSESDLPLVKSKCTTATPAPHLVAISTASLFGGGTVKHTEGTMASFPAGLMTFHLAR